MRGDAGLQADARGIVNLPEEVNGAIAAALPGPFAAFYLAALFGGAAVSRWLPRTRFQMVGQLGLNLGSSAPLQRRRAVSDPADYALIGRPLRGCRHYVHVRRGSQPRRRRGCSRISLQPVPGDDRRARQFSSFQIQYVMDQRTFDNILFRHRDLRPLLRPL